MAVLDPSCSGGHSSGRDGFGSEIAGPAGLLVLAPVSGWGYSLGSSSPAWSLRWLWDVKASSFQGSQAGAYYLDDYGLNEEFQIRGLVRPFTTKTMI